MSEEKEREIKVCKDCLKLNISMAKVCFYCKGINLVNRSEMSVEQSQQSPVKTLQECKDEVASKYGNYKNFKELISERGNFDGWLEEIRDQAAELYASQTQQAQSDQLELEKPKSQETKFSIKECPFCGNRPIWIHLVHPSGVPGLHCDTCGITMKRDRHDKAISNWNHRVPAKSPWIRVTPETIPENAQWILAYYPNGECMIHSWDSIRRLPFTHWMPLPSTPTDHDGEN